MGQGQEDNKVVRVLVNDMLMRCVSFYLIQVLGGISVAPTQVFEVHTLAQDDQQATCTRTLALTLKCRYNLRSNTMP